MSNPTAVDALIGALMPLVIAFINQAHWSSKVKGVVALVVCGVAAVVAEVLRGDLNWHDWRNCVIVIVGAALASYHAWWKPTTIAAALEELTTFFKQPPDPTPAPATQPSA